jgi:hypothetical protein
VYGPSTDVFHEPIAEPTPLAKRAPLIVIVVVTTPDPPGSDELAPIITFPWTVAPGKIAAENAGTVGCVLSTQTVAVDVGGVAGSA